MNNFKVLSLDYENHMNKFILKKTFIKVYIYHFLINIFYKNKKSKLCFANHVTVQNDFF